ncbi:MAG: NADP-dependent phosphogluconate dehydrogenase [Propionibacteriaceae bacterium]
MAEPQTIRKPITTPKQGSADVGVIGMGVMGTNLARNIARHGYKTAIWNLDPARTAAVAAEFATEGTFLPAETLADFVGSLKKPAVAIMMVTAGKPVDIVNSQLKELMIADDIIVDGGNSFFKDTIRREAELRDAGLHFCGIGISGGEVGALKGPSIMPGGSDHAYAALGPILEAISAHVADEPCCAHMGTDGAGHFVKMVHNGIEYADIEFIAETYDLMKAIGMDAAQMADTFRTWNSGELKSYLIDSAAEVLDQVDATTGKPLLDVIKDRSQMKGTGTWTVQEALNLGVPGTVIGEAVFARSLSSQDLLRAKAQQVLTGPERCLPADYDRKQFLTELGQALFAAKVIAYSQGLDQIQEASRVYNWNIRIDEVAKIWRDGCVIRAGLLEQIRNEYTADAELVSLMCAPDIAVKLSSYQDSWRRVVTTAISMGIPVPGFATALAYYDGARATRLPASMVQGLRDFFGAHTYERIDSPGHFHTNWSQDRSEEKLPDPVQH